MIARRLWLLLGGALLVGVATGAAWPPPPLPKAQTGSTAWNLPASADMLRHVPQDMAAVTSQFRWKGDAGGSLGERSTWRLAGVVSKDGPAILVMTPDKPDTPQRIALGGRLPDGSILQSARGDHATTRRDACTKTYQLFQAEAVDSSGKCEELEAPAQGNPQ